MAAAVVSAAAVALADPLPVCRERRAMFSRGAGALMLVGGLSTTVPSHGSGSGSGRCVGASMDRRLSPSPISMPNAIKRRQVGSGVLLSTLRTRQFSSVTCRSCFANPNALSLGFTADPRVSVERLTAALLRDAASLLLFQQALAGPPAQALLRLLLLLRRGGDDALKVLEAYGDFHRLMLEGGHASWQDYVLAAVLGVEKCLFATLSAAADSPTQPLPPHIRAAAAADLAALQRLAVADSTIVGWVCDVVPDVRPEWRAAAGHSRTALTGAAGQSKYADKEGEGGIGDRSAAGGSGSESGEALNGAAASCDDIASRLGVGNIDMWQQELGSLWSWAEGGVDMLHCFYFHHGIGAAALHRLLRWSEGRFVPAAPSASPFAAPTAASSPAATVTHHTLSCQAEARSFLQQALQQHLSGHHEAKHMPVPSHVLVYGPRGMGKSTIVRSVLLQLSEPALRALEAPKVAQQGAGDASLRIVELRKADFKSLPSIVQAAAGMPRLRFVLTIDDLSLRAGDEASSALKSALRGSSIVSTWPTNVILVATSVSRDFSGRLGGATAARANSSSSSSTAGVSPARATGDREQNTARAGAEEGELGAWFGKAFEIPALTQEEFEVCLQEIVRSWNHEGRVPDDVQKRLVELALSRSEGRSAMTVLSTLQCLSLE